MANKAAAERLLDSALWIAGFAGICYATGFLAHRRSMWEFGVPWYFLPDVPLHQALFVGAVYVILYVAIAVAVYIVHVNAKTRLPSLNRIDQYLKSRFENHPLVYPAFLSVVIATTLALVPMFVYPPSYFGMLQNRYHLRVIELELDNQTPVQNLDSWSYLCRKDGIIVLGQVSTRRYMLINEENVKRIVLDTPTKGPRSASNK